MPSDYARIYREKSKDYVELAERVGNHLAGLYSDRTHFVYELLQNAEDALRPADGPRRVRFSLGEDVFRFSHFGRGFDEEDVRAICDILVTTKFETTDIGHFGIGFKSVRAITDRPEVTRATSISQSNAMSCPLASLQPNWSKVRRSSCSPFGMMRRGMWATGWNASGRGRCCSCARSTRSSGRSKVGGRAAVCARKPQKPRVCDGSACPAKRMAKTR